MEKAPKNIIVTITSGTIVKALLFIALASALYYFWDLVLAILMAIVIASAVEPGVAWFRRFRVPRLIAVMAIYVGSAAILAGVFYLFIPPLLDDVAGFLNTLPGEIDGAALFGSLSDKTPAFLRPGIAELSENLSVAEIATNLRDAITRISGSIVTIASAVFGGLMSLVLIVVFSFYLAVQENGIRDFLHVVTPAQHEKYMVDLWRRSQEKIGRWMQGQLLLGLIIGILVYLGLTILSVRYALLLALLAGIFELIPVFGPILSSIPGITIGFIDGGITSGLMVAGLYVIIQQFENQLIYPLVVRKVVGVPPLLVILSLVVGARLAGFLGIVLSVPVAAAIREFVSDVEKHKGEEKKKLAKSVE